MSTEELASASSGDATEIKLFEDRIEMHAGAFGLSKKAAECRLDKIQKVVKSKSFLDEKLKLTIYFDKGGKQKRFGGMGNSVEGNLSDPEFKKFYDLLKEKVPETCVFEDKVSKKVEKTSDDGSLSYKLSPLFDFLIFKKYHHSGERMVYIIVAGFINLLLLSTGLFMAVGLYFLDTEIDITAIIINIIGVILILFAIKSMSLWFTGGMLKVFIYDDHLKINKLLFSKKVLFSEIDDVKLKKVSVTTRNTDTLAATSSFEYEFTLHPKKTSIVIGELGGEKFMEQLKEKGVMK